MTDREVQVGEAAVRMLKKAGGGMLWDELFNKLDGHILLRPSYAEILEAISNLVLAGRAVYRGDVYANLSLWLPENAPAVPPIDREAIAREIKTPMSF
jgi:hypothetical protein